jgi:hypothetical protein
MTVVSGPGPGAGPAPGSGPASQLVVVAAPGWDDSVGALRRFARRPGPAGAGERAGEPGGSLPWDRFWEQVDEESWPVRLGRHGLAEGRGLGGHPGAAPTTKREGDGRTPAGRFLVGLGFGRPPYRSLAEGERWDEDPASPTYNRLVIDPSRRSDPLLARQVVIGHNAAPDTLPGAGSAILFHEWRDGGAVPTAGCVAMSAAHLDALMGWLDPRAQPQALIGIVSALTMWWGGQQ